MEEHNTLLEPHIDRNMSSNNWDGGIFMSFSSDDVNMFTKKLDERLTKIVGAGDHEAVATLRDYILLLLRNGKVGKKLHDALVDLIGEQEADSLTKWIGGQLAVKEPIEADAHPSVPESSVTQRERTLPVVVPSVASVASVIERTDGVNSETIIAPLNRANDRMTGKGENDSIRSHQKQPPKDRAHHKVPSVKDSKLLDNKSVPVRKASLMASNVESDNYKPPQMQAKRQKIKPALSTSLRVSNTVPQAQSTRKGNIARTLTTNVGVPTITYPPVTATTPKLYNNADMKHYAELYQTLMMQQMSMWSSMLQLQGQYANGGLGPIMATPTPGSSFGLNNRFTRGRGRTMGRGRGRGKSSTRGEQERISHSLNRNSKRGNVTRTTMGRGSAQKRASKSVGGRTQHLQWTRPPSLEHALFSKR